MKSPQTTRPNTGLWQDATACAAIAVLVLLFFWRIWTPRPEDRAVFPPGDFTDQFWAFRMYAARAFAAGRLPLWSESFNSGHPFLADVQSAVFYPIGLVYTLAIVALRGANFMLFDLEIEAIGHFILTGIFTYFLARRLIGSRSAGLAAALIFVFGGYLTSYPPQQLAILETATWLPLALLCLDYGVEHRRIGYYLAAGVVLGTAALAGHPQTFLFVVYACAIFFAWRAWQRRESGSRPASWLSALAPFVLVLVIAAGISAAQMLPTLEYQSVSTRSAISWEEAARGFPTIDPLQMILPGIVAAFQSPLYIGILPLWLAIFALVVNRLRDKLFWAGLALGSLLVAFGFYVFAYAVLYLLAPGFAMFRDQERLAFIISLALALLAGFGFHDMSAPTLDRGRARRAWALLPAGITLSLMLLFVFYSAATLESSGRLAFLLDRSGFMVLLFVLATALVGARVSERIGTPAFSVLALALICFDLFSINSAAYNARPTARYPETPLVDTIRAEQGIFRVADEGKMPGHFGIGYGLEEIGGISPLRTAHYDELLNLAPERLLPLLNVRYLITGRDGFADSRPVFTEEDARLLRLDNTLVRAWIVGAARVVANDAAALEMMGRDDFNSDATAIIAEPPPFPIVPNAAFTPVRFEVREPERLVMTFSTPTDGLLVMSETYYPGWQATVDGVPTPILRADIALRALAVRAGAHRVELVYDPVSVKLGIGISVLTWLLVAGAALLGWMRGKRG